MFKFRDINSKALVVSFKVYTYDSWHIQTYNSYPVRSINFNSRHHYESTDIPTVYFRLH